MLLIGHQVVAKAAKALDLSVVLTASMEDQVQGALMLEDTASQLRDLHARCNTEL